MAWIQIQMRSGVLRMPVDLQVLLPERVGEEPLPTLYLLHDAHGNAGDWALYSALPRLVRELPVAVVLPSGNNSFYQNTGYAQPYREYLTEELPARCEGWMNLSPKRQARFIAGCGMGGYGALSTALAAPHRFAAAGAFYPALEPREGDVPLALSWLFSQRPSSLFEQLPPLGSGRPAAELLLWDGGDTLPQSERWVRLAQQAGYTAHCEPLGERSGWEGCDAAVRQMLGIILKRAGVMDGGR